MTRWRASCRTSLWTYGKHNNSPFSRQPAKAIAKEIFWLRYRGITAPVENQKPYFQLEKSKYKLNAAFGENMNIMLISNHSIQFVRFHLFLMETVCHASPPHSHSAIHFSEYFSLLLPWPLQLLLRPVKLFDAAATGFYNTFTRSEISRGVRIIVVHKSLRGWKKYDDYK